MSLLPVEDALERLLRAANPVTATEELPLAMAGDRVLATDLAARLTQPPFDASAMDGYAIRAKDIASIGAELSVIGTSSAGHGFDGDIGRNEAVRIFTGAPVPVGADTVLIQEDTEIAGEGRFRANFLPETGRHIRPRGQDFAEGEVVLSAGTALDFTKLTVAAAMNHASVAVFRKPLVAVLATGDELLQPGSRPGPSQIIASNTFGIGALLRKAGADILDLGIAPDDEEAIAAAIRKAQAANADVLVALGGASVGDHDLVQKTLKNCGMELDFWKIAMRPGKPLMVGRLDGMQVLGLPGNPASSLVCALLFAEPLIRKLAHLPPVNRKATVLSASSLPANGQRQNYMRARLIKDSSGHQLAEPFGKQDSSMMKVFAQADCLIVRPPHAPELPAAAPCPVILLRPEIV
ncbi:molybdopterin molybdotransferase MoeA [Rhizobium sp. PAMB 3174]